LLNGTKRSYVQFLIEGEHTLQQIIITRGINDNYAKEIQERIIKSIQIQALPKEGDIEE